MWKALIMVSELKLTEYRGGKRYLDEPTRPFSKRKKLWNLGFEGFITKEEYDRFATYFEQEVDSGFDDNKTIKIHAILFEWISNSKLFHKKGLDDEDDELAEIFTNRLQKVIINAPKIERPQTVYRIITTEEYLPSETNDRIMSCMYAPDENILKNWAIVWGTSFFVKKKWNLTDDDIKCCVLKFNIEPNVPRLPLTSKLKMGGNQREVLLPLNCEFKQTNNEIQVWYASKIDKHKHNNFINVDGINLVYDFFNFPTQNTIEIKVRVITYSVKTVTKTRLT